LIDLSELNPHHIISQLVAEVLLIGVAPLGDVSHRSNFLNTHLTHIYIFSSSFSSLTSLSITYLDIRGFLFYFYFTTQTEIWYTIGGLSPHLWSADFRGSFHIFNKLMLKCAEDVMKAVRDVVDVDAEL